ncbi:MAG: hypothetical protein JF887_14415 [Candidatus Dormibacteraeota bacterium]|uniref:Uncharacterized protein n=1 Tax=Candidatus Amunia macphersoniae TaxID=3127014 RepID=A0A934NFZ7_9BACT|nr:hypothetical protein [Candidatus Dormibacteraeota bacterium]
MDLPVRAEWLEGELILTATRNGYERLREWMRAEPEAAAHLEQTGTATGVLLAEVILSGTMSPRVTFKADGVRLRITGSAEAFLVRNFEGLGTVVSPGSHSHWDYFPGHPLLASDSVPTLVEVLPDGVEGSG